MGRGVNASELTNELAEDKVKMRGVEYVLRELPMDEYDKTVRLATTTDPDTKDEIFDGAAHTKILLARCLVAPKLTADQLYSQGTRLVRELQRRALRLHTDSEPIETDPEGGESTGEAPAES